VEGGVFLCSWKKVGGRYRVWVTNCPTLVADGDSFQLADEELSAVITEATGDGESKHEYEPPPPVPALPGLVRRLARVSGESRARIVNADALFSGGMCSECTQPRGERTQAPLVLESVESGVDGGLAKIGPGKGPSPHFFSESFLMLLSVEERALFEWRTVERQGRGKKTYYELVSCRVRVPSTALAGVVETLWGVPTIMRFAKVWTCGTCGYSNDPLYVLPQGLPYWYVAVDDLPDPLPTCFAVGHPSDPGLCFTRERWGEIVGRPGTRSVASSDVGVVGPTLVDRHPVRRPFAES
jgi:hypothetical protein